MTTKKLNAYNNSRKKNMRNTSFKNEFLKIQKVLIEYCETTFFECKNDETQALLEIFFSLKYNTEYNDWKTS